MASVNKLSIRGIRSFSHEREQVIEFYTPLTMIVGANGCGKTTVIESLKYACTGSLPPGARNGQSFVHDPKVSGTNEVKANIKLRFTGRDGRTSVVIRSFQLTQKRVTLQFKALDGVVRTRDDNGQSVSITHKCTELDKHIPLRLGVSKAILENVVFCHQEDSSWPLQEGAVVKKKFDDIFESARYTKALESIKKTKQEYASTAKDLKVDLASLQERLRAAEASKVELEAAREKHGRIRAEVEAIDARAGELNNALARLRETAEQVDILDAKKASLEEACKALEVRVAEKRANLGDDGFTEEPDDTLQRRLQEFDQKMERNADEIQLLSDEVDRCRETAAASKRRKDVLTGEKGGLLAKLQHQEALVSERDSLMERLSHQYGIIIPARPSTSGATSESASPSAGRFSAEDVASFRSKLSKILAEAKVQLRDAQAKAREEEDTLYNDISKLQLEQRTTAAAIHNKEEEIGKLQREAGSLAHGAGGSQSQAGVHSTSMLERVVKEAQEQAGRANKDFMEFEASNQVSKVSKETQDLELKLGQIKVEMDQAQEVTRRLNMQAEDHNKLRMLEAQVADSKSRLAERCKESLALNRALEQPLQGEEPSTAQIEAAVDEVRNKRAEKEEERISKELEITDQQRGVTEKETILGQVNRELVKVQRELLDVSEPVGQAKEILRKLNEEHGKDFDVENDFTEAVTFLQERVQEAVEDQHYMQHRKKFLKKLMKYAEQNNHVCGSCLRPMNEEEFHRFKENSRREQGPEWQEKLEATNREVSATVDARVRLEKLEQPWRDWKRITPHQAELEHEKEKVEGEVESLKLELRGYQVEAAALTKSRKELDQALTEAIKLSDEANNLDNDNAEVGRRRDKLKRLGAVEKLADAQERLATLSRERENAVDELQFKNRELQRLTQNQLDLTNNRNISESELKEAEGKLLKKQEFDRKRDTLREREKVLEAELANLRVKEQPLRLQLKDKVSQRDRARELAQAEGDRLHTARQECQGSFDSFGRAAGSLESSLSAGIPEALESVEVSLANEAAAVEDMEARAKDSEQEMNGKIMISDKHGQVKKVLRDNIEYRAHMRDLEEKRKEVSVVEEEIKKVNENDVHGQIQDLRNEIARKKEKRAELKGRLCGIQEQVKETEEKLSNDTYRNVGEKHRRKMIEHRTTEMAVSDLDKYWTALDKALLRFHTMKIADINKIIRELWAMTYSGEDIDMIEIVSGEEGESGGKAKRSYNYRVAMRKNDATLDMKGRCSAGQRVLASVVIRLALAETFCVSCGILALDEPTTNLDHDNKVGLAHALAKIISNRSKQANFQLVTITHDEEFVQTMRQELATQGGFSMPEYYWRISREELSRGKFYSRIDRLVWEDM